MAYPPPLTYHHETFNLIRRVPTLQNVDGLFAKIESIYHLTLPPSVREWYSLVESVQILSQYSNPDYPMELAEIEKDATEWLLGDWHNSGKRTPTTYPTIPFLWENQACFVACLLIDGSNDPPVVIWDDDLRWKQGHQHFSRFIVEWVWSFLDCGNQTDFWSGSHLQAKDEDLNSETLDFLRQHFVTETPIYLPSAIHTFSNVDQLIRVWERDNGKSDWWLFADSKSSLMDLTYSIWHLETLSKSLSSRPFSTGAEVLRKLRSSDRVY